MGTTKGEHKAHILYVEDDETLSYVTKDNLELNQFKVTHFPDGLSAHKGFSEEAYDLCIVDVMLPEMDGFQLAEKIRSKNTEIPILFLTAKSLKEDRIKGLQIGADDYITKPFSIEELILKIEVFLKRKFVVGHDNIQNTLTIGDYTLDYENLILNGKSKDKNLTQKEADLLKLLIEHKNNIVKRSKILERLWGENDYFMGRSMDVFISRIRKYLKEDPNLNLENIHGVGFRLNETN